MLEMISVIIIYSRTELNDKLLSKKLKYSNKIVLFDTFCYTEGM